MKDLIFFSKLHFWYVVSKYRFNKNCFKRTISFCINVKSLSLISRKYKNNKIETIRIVYQLVSILIDVTISLNLFENERFDLFSKLHFWYVVSKYRFNIVSNERFLFNVKSTLRNNLSNIVSSKYIINFTILFSWNFKFLKKWKKVMCYNESETQLKNCYQKD